MTISLLHPSRGRPVIAAQTFRRWLSMSSGQHKIEHILAIDADDKEVPAYKEQDYGDSWTVIHCGNNDCVVTATNKAAKMSNGDILVMLSDDFDCHKHWDISIVKAYEGKTGVLKTFDGLQKWIVTLAIMDRAYYESEKFFNGQRMNYFYYPEYKHMFCDTEMTHKAELEGKLIFRNDLIFKHNHYSRVGGKEDETQKRANATWNRGEAIYLRRVKECFGLTGVDPLNLCKEAAQSVQWLRGKLKVSV